MFEAVDGLVAEHAELEQRLADPSIHADQGLAKKLNQRYAELSAIVRTYREWQQLGGDICAAKELAAEDPAFAEEAEALAARRETTEERLRHLLVPRDASDSKDAILESAFASGTVHGTMAFFVGAFAALLTSFYSWRLIFLTFFGKARWAASEHIQHAVHGDTHDHPDEDRRDGGQARPAHVDDPPRLGLRHDRVHRERGRFRSTGPERRTAHTASPGQRPLRRGPCHGT